MHNYVYRYISCYLTSVSTATSTHQSHATIKHPGTFPTFVIGATLATIFHFLFLALIPVKEGCICTATTFWPFETTRACNDCTTCTFTCASVAHKITASRAIVVVGVTTLFFARFTRTRRSNALLAFTAFNFIVLCFR